MKYRLPLIALAGLAACAEPTDDAAIAAPAAEIVSVTVVADEDNAAARIVEWTTAPEGAKVSVSVASPRPESEAEMIKLPEEAGALAYTPDENDRRYFTVTPEGGEPVTTALRVLPLEGGRNFRDLGGYKTNDGRTVKWGLVYRSGVLHGLTDADYEFVGDLGIKTIVDFRATDEQTDEPTDWRAGDVEILAWDYATATSEMFAIFGKPDLSSDDVVAAMTGFYQTITDDHGEKYAVMFDRLIHSDAPLAFHCSAGKDRTGAAAALILSALDVPRETIIADYALSEQVVDYRAAFTSDDIDPDSPYAAMAKLPPEILSPLLRSDPVYIEATLDLLEERHGSVLAYIQTELGVDDKELAILRERLLD